MAIVNGATIVTHDDGAIAYRFGVVEEVVTRLMGRGWVACVSILGMEVMARQGGKMG